MSCVWVQLYYEGKREPEGQPIKITSKLDDVADLKAAVLPKLDPTELAEVFVYPPGTTPPFSEDKALKAWDPIPPNSLVPQPLIVVAPTPHPTPQQPQEHVNVRDGVFVLYRGDDKDVEPIGTAFAIAKRLLLTACHNVVEKEEDGSLSEKTELKVTEMLVKSNDGKMCVAEEGNWSTAVHVHRFNIDVDWACLKLVDENESFPFVVPIATAESDTPEKATLEKLYIYHCPVQPFLDDPEMEACHVMVKEASVGIVGRKTLNFQNGAFPGSCGGPYMYRNKAVALHVDSVSTTKIAEDFAEETKTDKLGRKRKLSREEMTSIIADSCASSHTSLGSGILLALRSGIINLLKE
jgi:hypothetical protein